MPDIFISYSRTDEATAQKLADALTEKLFTVWWDVSMVAQDRYREVIQGQIEDAFVVIVLWSANSRTSEWVLEEAAHARKDGKLVQVRIDAEGPPFGFGSATEHIVDLTDWEGDGPDRNFDQLLATIQQKMPDRGELRMLRQQVDALQAKIEAEGARSTNEILRLQRQRRWPHWQTLALACLLVFAGLAALRPYLLGSPGEPGIAGPVGPVGPAGPAGRDGSSPTARDVAQALIRHHSDDLSRLLAGKGDALPWMQIADAEMQKWTKSRWTGQDGKGLARINSYFAGIDFDNGGRPAPWAGAFVAYVLAEAGYSEDIPSGSSMPVRWRTFGATELSRPIPGAIVVLQFRANTYYVGFVVSQDEDAKTIDVLGGNLNDTVRVGTFKLDTVRSIRWPPDYPLSDAQKLEGLSDLELLALTIWGEARSAGNEGMSAVGSVILNRVRSSRFPNSVRKVVLGPNQFASWDPSKPLRDKLLKVDRSVKFYNDAMKIADHLLSGGAGDSTDGATYYYLVNQRPRRNNLTLTKRIGRLNFYRDSE